MLTTRINSCAAAFTAERTLLQNVSSIAHLKWTLTRVALLVWLVSFCGGGKGISVPDVGDEVLMVVVAVFVEVFDGVVVRDVGRGSARVGLRGTRLRAMGGILLWEYEIAEWMAKSAAVCGSARDKGSARYMENRVCRSAFRPILYVYGAPGSARNFLAPSQKKVWGPRECLAQVGCPISSQTATQLLDIMTLMVRKANSNR